MSVDTHAEAVGAIQVDDDEDFWATLMPLAAELVITAQRATPRMLQRKTRLPWSLVADLLLELHEAGVVGPAGEDGAREVLVPPGGLAGVLARLADLAGEDDEADEPEPVAAPPQPDPPLSLMKTRQAPATLPPGDPGGPASLAPTPPGEPVEPGGQLAIPDEDDLELYAPDPASLAPRRPVIDLVVRARQATARGGVWLVDQPAIVTGAAMGRQAVWVPWRLARRAPHGGLRAAILLYRWLADANSASLLARHSEAGEGEAYARVADARRGLNLAGRRWVAASVAASLAVLAMAWWAPAWFAATLAAIVAVAGVALTPRRTIQELGIGLAATAGVAGVAWWFGPRLAGLIPQPPGWVWWVGGGLAVAILGWLGRQEDTPIIEHVREVMPHKPPAITAPMVTDALCSLGNAKMREPADVIVLMDPREAGAGTQIDFELPKGVPASWVVKNREPLAAAMRHPLGCVWPSVGLRHPGHLSLYVSEQPMAQAHQKPWPLATAPAVDIFTPQPLVTDKRGDWVNMVLAYAAVVIGAQPRMGKTFFLRQLLLVAGLDVRTKVAGLDGKGTGDLSPTRLFADFYSVGDDPEEVEGRVLPFFRDLRSDMRRRAKFIRELPHAEAPESKVTSDLVDRHLHILCPRVVGIDETQSYFGYGDKKNTGDRAIRDEITAIVTDLVKRGPALGIWVILATQNVSEETIPRPISLNAVIRAALKLFDDSANNMVLGAGAYGNGVDATQFDFTDKGLMWMRGDGSHPFIGRSVVGLDAVAAESLAAKVRAMRVAAGLLTGQAVDDGVVEAEVVYDLVQDVEQVMRDRGCATAKWEELLPWLRELRGQYASLTKEELSASVRAAGVRVRDVRKDGATHKGVYLSDLRETGSQ